MPRRRRPGLVARGLRAARALSLDVVLGVACGGLLAESATATRLAAAWWVALLASVWSVYTADHLLDARRGSGGAYRHRFHRRHFRALSVALGAALLVAAGAGLRLPSRLVAFGLTLALVCVAYLASAQGVLLARLPREPVAGLAYAAGIWGGPLLEAAPRDWVLAAAGLHALAAVLNLAVNGLFEARLDARQGSRSLALAWGRERTRALVLGAGGLGVAVALTGLARGAPPGPAVLGVLAFLVAVPPGLLHGAGWFSRRQRYRVWGDLAFLAGAVPWLLGRLG